MLVYTAGMKKDTADKVMARVRALFEKSGMTLEELGSKMGYPPETARMSAWQFVSKTNDPRVSMLRKFAKAVKARMRDLFPD
jgi:transcriptional regulator with XRE-family HTH domain